MSGITISRVRFTSQIEAEVEAASLRTSDPSGATTRSTLDMQVSVQSDLRTSVTTLDPETAAAIIANIDAASAGQGAERRRLMLEGALSDLSEAMSQGQGAFYFNFRAAGGGGRRGGRDPVRGRGNIGRPRP